MNDGSLRRPVSELRSGSPWGAVMGSRHDQATGAAAEPQILLERKPDPKLTFGTLFPCKVNEFPLEVARTIAAEGGARSPFNPVYLYADIGVGKTHLLSAIANAADDKLVILVNTADLHVEFERAQRLGTRAELRNWLTRADILLLDDVQLCEGIEALQGEIFAILNHMLRDGRATVIASDVPPTRLLGIESRLLSRLGAGVILGLAMGDRSERMEILRRAVEPRELPPDVLCYLADNVTDNIRRLKAAARQLLAMEARLGMPISTDLARAVVPLPEDVRATARPARPGAPRPAMESVAERFKSMIQGAETAEEQVLALEIAVGERVRQFRYEGNGGEQLKRLETALERLREGRIEEAVTLLGM